MLRIELIDSLLRRRVEAQAEIDQVNREIESNIYFLSHSAQEADAEEALEIRTALYWPPANCSVELLSLCFDIPVQSFHKYVRPTMISAVCRECGLTIAVKATSRPKRAKILRMPQICFPCSDHKRQAREAEFLRQQEWLASEEYRARRVEELRTMPYAEYLQTPEWQEKRKAARAAAGDRCQVCHGKGSLDVHHRTYERRGDELPGDLTVLCRGCHETFHAQRKLVKSSD